MNRILFVVAVSIALSSCGPSDSASSINKKANDAYGVDLSALSYLVAGPRVASYNESAYHGVSGVEPIATVLKDHGYVRILTENSAEGARVVIERTSRGDEIHDQIIQVSRASHSR